MSVPDDDYVLGIDFGTTNSCISYFNHGKGVVDVIVNPQGNFTSPSCLCFLTQQDHKSEVLFGEPAFQLLNNTSSLTASSTIVHNFKRLLGIDWSHFRSNTQLHEFFENKGIDVHESDDTTLAVKIASNPSQLVPISEIIRLYLEWLLQVARINTGIHFTKVVVTVPVYFNENQRATLKTILSELNVTVLRIINEPTAAALAYGHGTKHTHPEETVLVIDCGGGTTDVSIIHLDYESNVYEVKTVIGDNYLGGEDLTWGLVDYVCQKNITNLTNQYTRSNKLTTKQRNRLRKECERVKCALSYSYSDNLVIENFTADTHISTIITRNQFYQCNSQWFKRLHDYIQEISLGYSETIDKVVLVGGTTKIPQISEICRQVLGDNVVICNDLDPDQTVSIGAAIQGHLLIDNNTIDNNTIDNGIVLLDVLNMTLGVETAGGLMTPIVSKNTYLPTSKTQIFTNSDGETDSITINIYQGERRFVQDNYPLGSFILQQLDDTMQCGEMRIKITFNVDVNGIISVTAFDTKTGQTQSITINKPELKSTTKTFVDTTFDTTFADNQRANQLLAKMELENTLQRLTRLFHDSQTLLIEKCSPYSLQQVLLLFDRIKTIITNYQMYTSAQLQQTKQQFEQEFHQLLLDSN